MSVMTLRLADAPNVVYQRYATTYTYSIFREALIDIRRHLISVDVPAFVIVDYRMVTRVRTFSMLRGGVLIERFRPPNALAGVVIAEAGSLMYRYNTLWLELGRAIGSRAAHAFHLTKTTQAACDTILHLADGHGVHISNAIYESPEFASTFTSENFNSSGSL